MRSPDVVTWAWTVVPQSANASAHGTASATRKTNERGDVAMANLLKGTNADLYIDDGLHHSRAGRTGSRHFPHLAHREIAERRGVDPRRPRANGPAARRTRTGASAEPRGAERAPAPDGRGTEGPLR